MIYLDVAELVRVAERATGSPALVRDVGLLAAAAARPQASAFGDDAYPSVAEKAAALLHSLANNHALVDGNKRLALAATVVFLGMNGWRLAMSDDEAYDLTIDVAEGRMDDIAAIALRLAPTLEPWRLQ